MLYWYVIHGPFWQSAVGYQNILCLRWSIHFHRHCLSCLVISNRCIKESVLLAQTTMSNTSTNAHDVSLQHYTYRHVCFVFIRPWLACCCLQCKQWLAKHYITFNWQHTYCKRPHTLVFESRIISAIHLGAALIYTKILNASLLAVSTCFANALVSYVVQDISMFVSLFHLALSTMAGA